MSLLRVMLDSAELAEFDGGEIVWPVAVVFDHGRQRWVLDGEDGSWHVEDVPADGAA